MTLRADIVRDTWWTARSIAAVYSHDDVCASIS